MEIGFIVIVGSRVIIGPPTSGEYGRLVDQFVSPAHVFFRRVIICQASADHLGLFRTKGQFFFENLVFKTFYFGIKQMQRP